MPAPGHNFDGISKSAANCNCAPPDPNGEVGATQYVQMVNKALQVFDKSSGASLLGPIGIATLWAGFGGVCEFNGSGDPIVVYDQLANRWVVSQFAGTAHATDECIAVSTSGDATGTYHRYGFHLGSDFFDYPKLGVWPDAYYMSMNVFMPGVFFMGPQPFAFDRAAMLTGDPATFITTGITSGAYGTTATYLPSDLDGATLPPAGAPNPFVTYPTGGSYKIYHFHVDFDTPANSSFTLFAAPAAAPFSALCTKTCVPQADTSDKLDGLGDRLMFRLAYRNFGDHESLVGNYSVMSANVAGVRWFELRDVTSGPVSVFQESTYQPDTTWRWMGSAAMDGAGNLAIGFSASSSTIHPQVRYAGRLAGDPLNTLGRGEATLHAGTGSQIGSGTRWGDYSDLTVDPVDDCTFWYTNEYYDTTGSFAWRTRIGSFKFADCPEPAAAVEIAKQRDAAVLRLGSQIGFTVTLRNVGRLTATGLNVTDELPAGGGIDWSIDAPNSDAGWSISGSPPGERLVYTPTTLAGHSSSHVHVASSTTAASCGSYDNSASFTSSNGGSGQASASTSVIGPGVSFGEDFDGVTAPALPAGWTATNASGPAPLWTTSASGTPTPVADTPPNAAYVDTPAEGSDKRLDSPPISVESIGAQLSFRHHWSFADGGDGGILEISIAGGAFTDIVAEGGTFVAGGYNLQLSGGPLAGRQAWAGSPGGGFTTTTVNLPASASGETIRLRWRMATDGSGGGGGWRLDSIQLADGEHCEGAAPTVALWNQYKDDSGSGMNSEDVPGANYDTLAADDFVVPSSSPGWNITGVYARGRGAGTSFNVSFYADSDNLPGALVASRSGLSYTGNLDLSIPVSPAVHLDPGTYWVLVQSNATDGTRWLWRMRTVQSGQGAAWKEGGAFGTGCTNWARRTTCTNTIPPDQIFLLAGTAGSPTSVSLISFRARPSSAGVTLAWRTASETTTRGFNVWRARQPLRWTKLNRRLIAARGTIGGSGYSYTDRSARRGTTYAYRLQIVGQDRSVRWGRTQVVRVR